MLQVMKVQLYNVMSGDMQLQACWQVATDHDKALKEVQGLVYGGLPIKLMAGQLLIGHRLQALGQGVVLHHKGVLLLLDGRVVMLQLLLLLL